MSRYYGGWRAQDYNRRWRTYTKKTLAETMAMIDFAALYRVPELLGRPPLVLDVACGIGIMHKQLIERVPNVQAYGVDVSADMLAQARTALSYQPNVQLAQAEVGPGETAGLPFAPGTFDLITCTNTLHDIADPVATFRRVETAAGTRRTTSIRGFRTPQACIPLASI